jgi:glucose-6-phosphate dehydrogenase assembly protein OpcA
VSADLGDVLRTLSDRRRHQHTMKVATMTVVVFFEDRVVGAWARDRIRALSDKHPSRVIVLDGTQGAALQEVDRGDWIELGAKECDPENLRGAIDTLCLPEAPVVLIWVATGIASDPRFAAIGQDMRTIVYNSSVLDLHDGALRELVAFAQRHPEVPVSDLAYLRLRPWQEGIALFFDPRDAIDHLLDVRRVEITCGSDAEAYYLLGWLASRLEWTPSGADAFCDRFGTAIGFAIHREGRARRIRRVALASSRAQFVAEIDGEEASAIVLTATGVASYPRRYHPISNIDIAALVERAILAGGSDRVYAAVLAATARILAQKGTSHAQTG